MHRILHRTTDVMQIRTANQTLLSAMLRATLSATVAVYDAADATSGGTTRSRFNADGVRDSRMCE